MMKPTLAVFLVLTLLLAGCQKEGDNPRSTGEQPDKQTDKQPDRSTDKQPDPSPKDRSAKLTGDWQADFDGSELRLKRVGGTYTGNYIKLSPHLESAHFAPGEMSMRGFKSTDGKSFKGEVKLRFPDKTAEWKPAVITLEGDSFTIKPGAPSIWARIPPKAAP